MIRSPWTSDPSLPLDTFWFGLHTPTAAGLGGAGARARAGRDRLRQELLSCRAVFAHPAGRHAGHPDRPARGLAELVLTQLIARGALDDPVSRSRLIYLDLPAAAARGEFLPLNVLAQPYSDHAMAEHLAEAFRRAWPELATGAPTFEKILKHSVIALRQAGQPLTALARLLTDRDFRERVLTQVTDEQVLRFFHDRLDA